MKSLKRTLKQANISADLPVESSKKRKLDSPTRYIIWLRNDLRIRDNYVLQRAMKATNKECIPVFCFDPRIYQDKLTKYNTRKTGLNRLQF